MLENQFIRVNNLSLAIAKLQKPLPVVLGSNWCYGVFFDEKVEDISAVDANGNIYSGATLLDESDYLEFFGEPAQTSTGYFQQLNQQVYIGDTFFLKAEYLNGDIVYSQPLISVPATEMAYVRYRCNEDALGFPFHTEGDLFASAYIPLRIYNPQLIQDDKTYVKSNGEVVTLYAKYYKEYEGETEYLREDQHDKIVAALACDEVYIDGKRVTKSDSYQINWDNYDIDCDGRTKIARATFKVRENITQRNSNY